MDLTLSPDVIAFRDDVRDFMRAELPLRMTEKVRLGRQLVKEDYLEWHALLRQRGWLAGNWPRAHGGAEWSAVQRHLFDIEATAANAPRILPFGLVMLGPVLMAFGSEAQQKTCLPRILADDDWWCQGYSEPGAGSDLASLRTTALREGDHYIVNGQKTWTTLGHYANRMFCLVRTDPQAPKKQAGISFLLIDMDSDGVEVRPIRLVDGSAEVNEVFLRDVRVPVENLVGTENDGWTIAKYLLTHERTGIAGVGFARAGLAALKRIAAQERDGAGSLAENALFAARIARVEIALMAMETTNLRVVAAAAAGQAPGPESSMLKVKGTQIRQEITDLIRRAAGPYALPFQADALAPAGNTAPIGPEYAPAAAPQYFNNRKLSIYGGSNEIQRGIISKAMLGL